MTQCGVLETDRRVGNTCGVHLTGRRITFFSFEVGVGKFLQKSYISTKLNDVTVQKIILLVGAFESGRKNPLITRL
jgi:hypothetical protein